MVFRPAAVAAALCLFVGANAATLAHAGDSYFEAVEGDPTAELIMTDGTADLRAPEASSPSDVEIADAPVDYDVVMDDYLPTWYAYAGGVLLHRSTPGGSAFVASNPGGAPFRSGSDIGFGWSGGWEGVLARRLENGDSVQFRYLGVDSNATDSFVSPGAFIGVGFTGPGGTNFAGRYETSLDSAEFNYRRATSEQVTWFAGFRYFEVRDDMTYKLNGNVATGKYNYNNYLYGGQLGLDWLLTDGSGPWRVNVIGAAGVYANFADGGIYEFQGNNFIGTFNTDETRGSFVGEIGLNASYWVTDRCAIRVGYELLFLSNLGLASDNAAVSLLNPSLLNGNVYTGDLFYHGATAGLECYW